MDEADHTEQVARSLSTAENLKKGASKARNALGELALAEIHLLHADDGGEELQDELAAIRNELEAFEEETNDAIASVADAFDGFACTVVVYDVEDSGPRPAADYIFEVEEEQRNQRHEFAVSTDDPGGAPEIITSARVLSTLSMSTGEDLNPNSFGSSAGVAWDNAVAAVVDAGKFQFAKDDAANVLVEPEG